MKIISIVFFIYLGIENEVLLQIARSFLYLSGIMNEIEIFFNAIRNGDLNLVEELLNKTPELLAKRDQRGSTPLVLSTYYNQLEITDVLIKKGAKINDKDSSGNTALMGVCFKGFVELAKKLVASGADVNLSNTMGATSLIYAATFNRIEIAKILLEHEADINAKDARGNTALDHAKMQDAKQLIDLLEKYA